MVWEQLDTEVQGWVREVLGYLNFSSGATDTRFLRDLDQLFSRQWSAHPHRARKNAWKAVTAWLEAGAAVLEGRSSAFGQLDQAKAVLRLVFDRALPAYRLFHRDLLFHQSAESLFQPFFVGRVCEAVLAQGPPWTDEDRVVGGAIKKLNDYIGHRPVAVLETVQKLQPYEHEWVRPIPLYIEGVGVATGTYQELISKTLEILGNTGADLLRQAWFDPKLLAELALDPRAFDFDHPVNRRPNHHFGGWDPHAIDNRGFYRRFVLQQVTLDAIMARLEECEEGTAEERLFEAGAVLAGTMLMGSAITGNGPAAHDSGTSLATLLPRIAAYRDAFYERLLKQITGPHGRRLQAEAARLRQPLAGARQDLNQKLARRRAEQLQHVTLARLYSQMGYAEAAGKQAAVVPVASARMRSEIDNRLAAGHMAIDRRDLETACGLLPEIEDLLHRAVECGAFVDPWNILGFGAQFSLFPAVENSVHDHRVDELVELVGAILGLYARAQKESAAAGRSDLERSLAARLEELAVWWDQFASTEVGEVRGVSGRAAWESSGLVAEALGAWYRAGTAAGDIAFWRKHVDKFRSAKAYALVVETLLGHGDLVASMSLLMHWLSRADEVPLSEGSYSFHLLAARWMDILWQPAEIGPAMATRQALAPEARWPMACKFFDYFEANADDYAQPPRLELEGAKFADKTEEEEGDADQPDGLFAAAYENFSYRDTANDGVEGEMLEGAARLTDFELTHEAERLQDRLAVLLTLARLWKFAAAGSVGTSHAPDRGQTVGDWAAKADGLVKGLLQLAQSVHGYRIPSPRGSQESLIEYDRRRVLKEGLLDRVIAACNEMADSRRFVLATLDDSQCGVKLDEWDQRALEVLRGLFKGDVDLVRSAWPAMLKSLASRPLLYIPTQRGGSPKRVIASRSIQRVLRRLLEYLPRAGLLTETYRLLETVHVMERRHPVGSGAITEFDRLFEIGLRGIVQCLVASSEAWEQKAARGKRRSSADHDLVSCLEHGMEALLKRWLTHARTIRISVVESLGDDQLWRRLKEFIERYGEELFTQHFMNFGNLRGILHEGVGNYLRALEEEPENERPNGLIADIDRRIARDEAERWLELTIEAVVEHYSEYIDYNSTTTQSDRGDMLYTLLDFLRVQASYDRVAWNLRPVVLAHQVLVKEGRDEAAKLWRRAMAQRSKAAAATHWQRYERLSRLYGMRLPSIADRLEERFVRPLDVDCLCALVKPAMDERRRGEAPAAFARLEKEAAKFTRQPIGVGFDVPPWLEALQREVHKVRSRDGSEDEISDPTPTTAQVRLPRRETERQIEAWG